MGLRGESRSVGRVGEYKRMSKKTEKGDSLGVGRSADVDGIDSGEREEGVDRKVKVMFVDARFGESLERNSSTVKC